MAATSPDGSFMEPFWERRFLFTKMFVHQLASVLFALGQRTSLSRPSLHGSVLIKITCQTLILLKSAIKIPPIHPWTISSSTTA